MTNPIEIKQIFANPLKKFHNGIIHKLWVYIAQQDFFKSKLQVLSFMFTPNCRRCPLAQKLTSFVLNVSKSCTLCPLGQTQLGFFVKSGHVPCT
ncbi:hypothetical protein Hanom_Chr14g01327811 [Helianthus anomalus]